MLITQSSNYLFYCAGKIGTTSLTNLPNSKVHTPKPTTLSNYNNHNYSLRKDAVNHIKRLIITNNNLETIIVIRDPTSRFLSGLYEIMVKQIYLSGLIAQAELGVSSKVIQGQIEIMYNPLFWLETLKRTLLLRPQVWDSKIELKSIQWQFHVGNWLADAKTILEELTLLQRSVTILDINNLSSFLLEHNLPVIHYYKKEDLFQRLRDLSESYTDIANNADGKKIYDAFLAAYSMCHPTDLKRFETYLEDECKIYEELVSKSLVY